MKQYYLRLFAASALIACTASHAAIPNTDQPVTFLGPTLHGGFTGPLTDTSAYSFAAELGTRNARAGGTFGWQFLDHQRLKLSGDFLWQNIQYPFFSGNAYQGVTQGELGGLYQYEFAQTRLHPLFNLGVYYANASTFALDIDSGTYVAGGVTRNYVNERRIAGSNATGASPGFSIQPWRGNRTSIEFNYDNVRYLMKYQASQTAQGWGGTLRMNQMLTERVELGAAAAVRQPFNNYQADIIWNNLSYGGIWALKLTGAYTIGKNTMPDTYNIGFAFDYFLDMFDSTSTTAEAGEALMAWVARPAVYLPQVLAVPDENVTIS